jgi:hypothetical protein
MAGADLFWEKSTAGCWLIPDGWFVLSEKYWWLVADKPNEQAVIFPFTTNLMLMYSSLERHTWHATATERQRPSLTNGAASRSPSLIGQAPSSLLLSSSPGLKVSFTLVLVLHCITPGAKKEKETINSWVCYHVPVCQLIVPCVLHTLSRRVKRIDFALCDTAGSHRACLWTKRPRASWPPKKKVQYLTCIFLLHAQQLLCIIESSKLKSFVTFSYWLVPFYFK